MWVSKYQWDRMNERLDMLEKALLRKQDCELRLKETYPYGLFYSSLYYGITVTAAIEKILDHLKLTVEKTPEIQSRVEFVKKK